MTNPIVDLIGDRTGRIVPIYPQSEGAALHVELAGWIENALDRCRAGGWPTRCPTTSAGVCTSSTRARRCARSTSQTIAAKDQARRRLAFDELLRVQLALVRRKRRSKPTRSASSTTWAGLVRRFHDALPYTLTGAQRRVIGEIDDDLSSPRPMHRLLQGDVGSGKTVVAVTALLSAVQSGNQGPSWRPPRCSPNSTCCRCASSSPTSPYPTRQPLRRPPAARRAADQPDHRQCPEATAGRTRRRRRRHRHRHPRPHPDGGRIPSPRSRHHRRAAPLRCRAALPRCATRRARPCPTSS